MANRIMIGAAAVAKHFKDFRSTSGVDMISWDKKVEGCSSHYSPAFEYLLKQDKVIASPDELYTIKVSHATWDVSWTKTMWDIGFLQTKGCKVIEPFYKELYRDWELKHGPKRIQVDIPDELFFNSKVKSKFTSEYIRQKLMFYDVPLYDQLKYNQESKWIEQYLFERLSPQDKIRMVREEAYVLALERYLIPTEFSLNTLVAYRKALKALVIYYSRGWFPRFIIDNWVNIRDLEDCSKYLNFIEREGLAT